MNFLECVRVPNVTKREWVLQFAEYIFWILCGQIALLPYRGDTSAMCVQVEQIVYPKSMKSSFRQRGNCYLAEHFEWCASALCIAFFLQIIMNSLSLRSYMFLFPRLQTELQTNTYYTSQACDNQIFHVVCPEKLVIAEHSSSVNCYFQWKSCTFLKKNGYWAFSFLTIRLS